MYFIGHLVLCFYIVSVSIQLTAAIHNKPFIHYTIFRVRTILAKRPMSDNVRLIANMSNRVC